MVEKIVILLIEDSESDARTFEFQVVKHPQLSSLDVETVCLSSVQAALNWLSNAPTAPHVVCFDLAVPGLTSANMRATIEQISKYVPKNAIIALTESDNSSQVWQALERVVGQDNVFAKTSVQTPSIDQNELLETIKRAIASRTSGSSREIQIGYARLEERVIQNRSDIQQLEQLVQRLNDTVFSGGDGAIAAIALRMSQLMPQIVRQNELSDLVARVKTIEDSLESTNIQIKLKRLDFWLNLARYAAAFVVAAIFIVWLGPDIAAELIKVIVN